MSTKAKIMTGAAWLAAARLLVNLLGFVSTFILARLLTPDDFGVVAIGLAVQGVVQGMLAFSAGAALVRLRRVGRAHLNTSFTLGILRALVVALVMAIVAYPVAEAYGDPRVLPILLVIGLTVIVAGFENPAGILYYRDLVFWQQLVTQGAAKFVSLIVAVVIAWHTGSYWALVFGSLAAETARVITSYAVRPYFPRFSLKEFPVVWDFAKNMSLASIINTLNDRFNEFLVPAYLPAAFLGYLSMGNQVATLAVKEAIQPITVTLYPAFAKMTGNLATMRANYFRVTELLTSLTLPAGVGVALLGESIVYVALGPGWEAAVIVVQVASIVAGVNVMLGVTRNVAMSLNATADLRKIAFRNFIIRVPVAIIAITNWGFVGLILSRFVMFPILFLQNQLLVNRLIGANFFLFLYEIRRTLLATAVMALVIVVLQRLPALAPLMSDRIVQLAVLVPLGVAVYGLVRLVHWQLDGRPEGPESDALSAVHAARARLAA